MRTISSLILLLGLISFTYAGPACDFCEQADFCDKKGENTDQTGVDYLNTTFQTIAGKETKLADFSGQVILIVNTASKCGFTSQYEGLQKIYDQYRDQNFTVIGFPANNFLKQEPGTNEEIQEFCSTNYSVTFPLMSKISVKGEDIHPLYQYLTAESSFPGEISWNFNKFLLDRQGRVVARYGSKVKPEDPELINQLEKLLTN